MEFFSIYDRFGEKTGERIERTEAHRTGACHRVFHLWLLNGQNQVLLQQRSASKDAGANLWYVSVGGHIAHGESIAEAIRRETAEELGLDISAMMDRVDYLFTFHETKREHGGTFLDDEFYDVFVLRADFPLSALTLQAEEVQAAKYVDYAAFRQAILDGTCDLWPHDIAYQMLVLAMDDYLRRAPGKEPFPC